MRKPAAASGLPHARLHDLRHVHATTCSWPVCQSTSWRPASGTPTRWITLKVYAHVLREQAAGVADVFASAIEAAS